MKRFIGSMCFMTLMVPLVIYGFVNRYKIIVDSVVVTAYSPSPHITQGDPFQMASGRHAKPQDLDQLRYVAMSRDLLKKYNIKYGDTIWIAFQVEDTMNPKVKNGVDLFMRNLSLARKFGRQTRKIIFLKKLGERSNE